MLRLVRNSKVENGGIGYYDAHMKAQHIKITGWLLEVPKKDLPIITKELGLLLDVTPEEPEVQEVPVAVEEPVATEEPAVEEVKSASKEKTQKDEKSSTVSKDEKSVTVSKDEKELAGKKKRG